MRNSPPEFTDTDRAALAHFSGLYSRAEAYYAFTVMEEAVGAPFRTQDRDTTFNAARFLVMRLAGAAPPLGVSLCAVLHALARTAEEKGAWKLARFAYQRLSGLRVRAKGQGLGRGF